MLDNIDDDDIVHKDTRKKVKYTEEMSILPNSNQ